MVRGWRRCGKQYYLPMNDRSCCSFYPIRLDPSNFEPSKSQRRVLRRVDRFLLSGNPRSIVESSQTTAMALSRIEYHESILKKSITQFLSESSLDAALLDSLSFRFQRVRRPRLTGTDAFSLSSSVCNTLSYLVRPAVSFIALTLLSLVSLPFTDLRQLNRSGASPSLSGRDIADRVNSLYALSYSGRVVTENGYVIVTDPTVVAQDSSEKPENTGESKSPLHRLEMRLLPSSPSKAKFQLFRSYQKSVHGDDDSTMSGFSDFLCGSNLQLDLSLDPSIYGSRHMGYFLDDKLIAFSTLDILPHYVSSVYFCYNPEYKFLDLGKYSALKEIDYCLTLPGRPYYCMGFYIPTCQKMRYKGEYHPSEILNPPDWKFYPLLAVYPKLEKNEFRNTDFGENSERSVSLRRAISAKLSGAFKASGREKLLEEFFFFAGAFPLDRFSVYCSS